MAIFQLLDQPIVLVAWLTAIVFVISIHEFCHALAASLLGDDTAERAGRLTLNPLLHISWTGLLMLVVVGFGWGNPVPFNPYNLRNQRWGPALVALAGPLSNLIMSIFCIIIYRWVVGFSLVGPGNMLLFFLYLLIQMNIVLMVFNLIPVPPLDGSKILFAFLDENKYANIKRFLDEKGPTLLLVFVILDNFSGLNILGGLLEWGFSLVQRYFM